MRAVDPRYVPVRAALLGLATGGRSTAGLTAVVRTADGGVLMSAWARRLSVVASVGEVVADKLPGVPSRLSPPALVVRIVAGAAAGALLSRRVGRYPVAPAIVAAGFTVAGSAAGAYWRSYADRRGWPALPVALGEDVVVLTLAEVAVRGRFSRS